MQLDRAHKEYAALVEFNKEDRRNVDEELRLCKEQLEHLAFSLSKVLSEKNMYNAEAHAKEVEHDLVSQRFLEIRLENDVLKNENSKLREALKTLGQDIDELMTQQKMGGGDLRMKGISSVIRSRSI